VAIDPFTVAFLAKTGFDIFSAYSAGEAAKKRAQLQAQLAEMNARAMEQDAFEVIKVGLAKKAHYESKVQQITSSQNVAYAVADVDTSFGTAKQVQEESRLMGQLNAKDIEDAAYAQAVGYKSKVLQYRFGSEMDQVATKQKADNLLMSTILQSGASTAMNWNKLDFGNGGVDTSNAASSSWDKMLETTAQGLNWSGTYPTQPANNMGLTLRF
jgi:hypothetical protein